MSLEWACRIDWQAIATAVTGVLAVGAAFCVGRKQTKILDRQTELIENELKIQLLEKRSTCINSMRKIHFASERGQLSDDEWRDFYNLSLEAKLLYPEKITKLLDEAVSVTFDVTYYRRKSEQSRIDGNTKSAERRSQIADEAENKAMKIMPTLLDTLTKWTRVDF